MGVGGMNGLVHMQLKKVIWIVSSMPTRTDVHGIKILVKRLPKMVI
jgi:hypothetical protein